MSRAKKQILNRIHQRLSDKFGPQYWWPGDTDFEVIVGAILTQNTNWTNVEKAILNLKKAGVLSPQALHELAPQEIAELIRPSGYFNIKAKRLKNFLNFLFKEFGGSIAKMKKMSLEKLRPMLLSVNGIGPETADSILLYALDKPIFVIDAYTKRILTRHGLAHEDVDYHTMQKLFHGHIPADVQTFNEYHALIVHTGKHFCRPKARCEECPLNNNKFYLS